MCRAITCRVIAALIAVSSAVAVHAQPPPPEDKPPPDTTLPSLPPGLSDAVAEDTPPMPPGLGATLADGDDPSGQPDLPGSVSGFVEARFGLRTRDDPRQKATAMGELRAQLRGVWERGPLLATLTSDLVIDPVADAYVIDLESGGGVLDLREANILWRPFGFSDLKIGRQVLTWGTGDLVFINDLFPKDFRSFFIGRDDEYLKAPSDALRTSIFTRLVNLDLVYTPRFDADRYISGQRLSYFDPLSNELAGRNRVIHPVTPNDWFDDHELAVRASRSSGSFELAAYAYRGFWKGPQGVTPQGRFFFPRLSVVGASVRGPLAQGLLSLEAGVYDSRDDPMGSDPGVPNSEVRYLLGYERETLPDLTVGLQYYAEVKRDFSRFQAARPAAAPPSDRIRHMLTLRLTQLAMNQNLTLGLFAFWSPNDGDGYLRGDAGYKLDDHWLVEAGFNTFIGDRNTFFGQFQTNANVYLGLRRSF